MGCNCNINGEIPNWGLLKKDISETLKAARQCNLEFCYRYIYTINGERPRLKKRADLSKSLINI
jgi:hypothetical protein